MAASYRERTTPRLEQFLAVVQAARRVLVLTHNNPDPDSVASAAGLAYLIARRTKTQPVFAYGGLVGRAENQELIRVLKRDIVPALLLDFSNFDLAILADARRGSGNTALPEDFDRYCEFDHHDEAADFPRPPVFTDVRTDYGATSTIVTEYLRAARLCIPEDLATALLYGIKADTQNLNRMTGAWDTEAYLHLFPRANMQMLHQIERPPLPRAYFKDYQAALKGAEVFGPVVVAGLGEVGHVEIVAELADTFLRLTGVRWAFCTGFSGEDMALSMRTCEGDVTHAGRLMSTLVKGRGIGGGHAGMAGGRIGLKNPDRAASYEQHHRGVKRQFLAALGQNEALVGPLIAANGSSGTNGQEHGQNQRGR